MTDVTVNYNTYQYAPNADAILDSFATTDSPIRWRDLRRATTTESVWDMIIRTFGKNDPVTSNNQQI